MTYKTLVVERKQGVGVIWMNRPEQRNALDETMIKELTEAFSMLEEEPEVRGVVLAGAGACFCSGIDREGLLVIAGSGAEKNRLYCVSLTKLFQIVNNLSKPTIARIHGLAFGYGAGLVATCDMAVCDFNAEFCLADLRVGLLSAPEVPFLIKAIGERMARRYLISGEIFTAAEAYRIGLLTDIAPPVELDARVNELLGNIIQGAPSGQVQLKNWIRATTGLPITPGMLEDGAVRFATACADNEFQQGIDDLLSKRKPHWLSKKKQPVARKKVSGATPKPRQK